MKRICRMRWETHSSASNNEVALLHVEDSLFDSSRDEEAVKSVRTMMEVVQRAAQETGHTNPFAAFEKQLPPPLNDNERELLNALLGIHGVIKSIVRPYNIAVQRTMVVEWHEVLPKVIQVVSDYLNVDVKMLPPIED